MKKEEYEERKNNTKIDEKKDTRLKKLKKSTSQTSQTRRVQD